MSDDAIDADAASTMPRNLSISLRGFESEEAARKFAGIFSLYLQYIGVHINLERLDGITVAYDYVEALAELDRGIEGLAPLTATATEYGVGVAMTPAVIRDGIIKSHIVFNALVVRELEGETDKIDRSIIYTVAHECAHVHDLKARDDAFPNTILKRKPMSLVDRVRSEISEACWEEYAACRISAAFSSQQTVETYEQVFLGAATDARQRANEAIEKYRIHGDLDEVVYAVAHEYGNVLKFASYLLGTLHGRDAHMYDAPLANKFIESSWCREFITRLDTVLRKLFERYAEWEDENEFDPLRNIAEEIVADGGLFFTRAEGLGVHVAIPFTAETMP